MNKKILFLVLVMVFLLPCMFSCSKRDKLTANTMLVSIEPKVITVAVGDSVTLSAVVRNAKCEAVTPKKVSWSVEPSDFGTFDNPNSSTTVFTRIGAGTGEVVLVCEGIQTSANVN